MEAVEHGTQLARAAGTLFSALPPADRRRRDAEEIREGGLGQPERCPPAAQLATGELVIGRRHQSTARLVVVPRARPGMIRPYR